MQLYSYVVKHDRGFAPNPFWEYCTLACCKPKIRKSANVGDWVIGTGSVQNIGNDKLVYAMKVTEKITFDQYFKDSRFHSKIPGKGRIEEAGDNIYYKNDNGEFMQCESSHTEEDKERDLSTHFVLISDHYFYFGKKGVVIPDNFKEIVKSGPGHKCNFDSKFINEFIHWLESNFSKGLNGEPFSFKKSCNF